MKKQRFVFLPVLLFLTCGNSYAPSILKIEQKHKNQNSVLRDLSAKSTMISSYTMTYNGSFVPGNMVKLQYTGDFNSSTCGFIYVNLESIGYKKSDYRSFSISIKGNFIPSGADYFIKDYYGLSSFACSMSNGIISFDATKLTLQNGSVAGCLYHLTPSSAIIENYNPYDISYSYKLKKHHDSFHSEQNYGDDYYQMMYIDIPEGYYDDIPVVMNIYGSNYHRGDIEAYSYLQEPLFENKFVQVRFDYRTSNELSSRPYLPYMMDDIRQAINKIKKNSRYGHRLSEFQHQYRKNLLMGHSSGGNLALDYSISENNASIPVTLVISEGAPTNFGKDHEDCINPNCPNKNYTAETAKDTYLNLVMEDKDSTEANKAEKLKQISPAMLIQDSKKTLNQLPFFFISHYTNDTFVCYRFAEEFIEGIKKKDPKSTRYKSYIKACTEITSGSDVHNSYNTIDFNVYKDTLEAFKEGKYDL